jgi:hypothetical protein
MSIVLYTADQAKYTNVCCLQYVSIVLHLFRFEFVGLLLLVAMLLLLLLLCTSVEYCLNTLCIDPLR